MSHPQFRVLKIRIKIWGNYFWICPLVEPVDLTQDLQELRGFPGSGRSGEAQQEKADLQASRTFTFMLHLKKNAPHCTLTNQTGYATPTEAQAGEPGIYPHLNPPQHRAHNPHRGYQRNQYNLTITLLPNPQAFHR